ncbi:MAG TPA: hypothetical protein VKT32_16240 [Chthonomonadaceae bacterium]|nr:hypothetical protein [Chthonomonadaceae bacterium]
MTINIRSASSRTWSGSRIRIRTVSSSSCALLGDRFAPKPLAQVKIRFPVVEGKTLCRVDVAGDPSIIYHLDGEIYVRDGNQTVLLTGRDRTDWTQRRLQGNA